MNVHPIKLSHSLVSTLPFDVHICTGPAPGTGGGREGPAPARPARPGPLTGRAPGTGPRNIPRMQCPGKGGEELLRAARIAIKPASSRGLISGSAQIKRNGQNHGRYFI